MSHLKFGWKFQLEKISGGQDFCLQVDRDRDREKGREDVIVTGGGRRGVEGGDHSGTVGYRCWYRLTVECLSDLICAGPCLACTLCCLLNSMTGDKGCCGCMLLELGGVLKCTPHKTCRFLLYSSEREGRVRLLGVRYDMFFISRL